MSLDLQIRTLIRTRTRTRRRFACHRHPNEPVTGFCALCLRDRLVGLDSSTAEPELEHIVAFPLSRRTRGHGGASSSGVVPELRRSKSVAVEKCEILNGISLDLRRKSCDVRASNRLSDLFGFDDTKSGGHRVERVESKNLGFLSIAEREPELEINENNDDRSGIRISDHLLVRNEVDDDGEIEEEEDVMTMKEHIDMELQNKKRNIWETASVFSKNLRKWRQKHKEKKLGDVCNGGTDHNRSKFEQSKHPQIQPEVTDYGLGRRSCDIEPRFSVDANRMSVEDPRFQYDEHRASWDGYVVARTIPRLTPMLPIVDNMMLPPVNNGITVDNQQSHLIKEEGLSSGGSAQSNSDSSSSNTGSSSSSIKSSSSKTAGLEGDYMKSNKVIGQETKLVITERELKDWHLSSINDTNTESASNASISTRTTLKMSNGHKRETTSRWRKVSNLWNYKHDKKNGDYIQENGATVTLNNMINGDERGNSRGKLVRNSSYVGSRTRTESHHGEEGARYSMSDLDSGLLGLYLSPFRKSRKSKS